jgi:hypothetical protein
MKITQIELTSPCTSQFLFQIACHDISIVLKTRFESHENSY